MLSLDRWSRWRYIDELIGSLGSGIPLQYRGIAYYLLCCVTNSGRSHPTQPSDEARYGIMPIGHVGMRYGLRSKEIPMILPPPWLNSISNNNEIHDLDLLRQAQGLGVRPGSSAPFKVQLATALQAAGLPVLCTSGADLLPFRAAFPSLSHPGSRYVCALRDTGASAECFGDGFTQTSTVIAVSRWIVVRFQPASTATMYEPPPSSPQHRNHGSAQCLLGQSRGRRLSEQPRSTLPSDPGDHDKRCA